MSATMDVTRLRREFLTQRYAVLNIAWLMAMHIALVGWFALAPGVMPTWAYFLLSPLVCLSHQRFLSEWLHEASHYNLVPNRRWNDLLTNAFIGVWLGTAVAANRAGHLGHHRQANFFHPDDPDTAVVTVQTRRELVQGLILDLIGYNALRVYLRTARGSGSPGNSRHAATRWLVTVALIHGILFAVTVAVGRFDIYPLYYITLLTLYPVMNRLRLYGQHACVKEDGSAYLTNSTVSRRVAGSVLDKLFFMSSIMEHHGEHHRQPALPYRALKLLAGSGQGKAGNSCLSVCAALWRSLP